MVMHDAASRPRPPCIPPAPFPSHPAPCTCTCTPTPTIWSTHSRVHTRTCPPPPPCQPPRDHGTQPPTAIKYATHKFMQDSCIYSFFMYGMLWVFRVRYVHSGSHTPDLRRHLVGALQVPAAEDHGGAASCGQRSTLRIRPTHFVVVIVQCAITYEMACLSMYLSV